MAKVEACNYDGGDCDDVEWCALGCPTTVNSKELGGDWRGDCICDPACNVKACEFDRGDCAKDAAENELCNQCAPGCFGEWLADGTCDLACDNDACGRDGGGNSIHSCSSVIFGSP
jgi:hypothetical protein